MAEPNPKPNLLVRLRGSFEHTPRTLLLLFRSAKLATITLFVLTLAAAVLPLGVAYAGKAIVDAVAAHSREATLRWVLVELALVAALALVQRGMGLLRSLIGARLGLDINGAILEKALTLELRHFEEPQVYDQLTRARREASSRPLAMVTETFGIVQSLVTLAGYGALLFRWSGFAVLALALASLPGAIAEVKLGNLAFRLRNWRSPEARKLNYLEYVLANDAHAKEVKLFGIGQVLLERYRALGEKFYREDRALAVQRAGLGWGLSLLGTGAFYACYASMALGAARGDLTLGDLVLYGISFRQGQQAFQSILSSLGGMYEHNLYMSNLFSYLAIPTNDGASAPKIALPDAAKREVEGDEAGREQGIRFEGVSFRYPGQEKLALAKLDLFVPRGQSVALVGHNGAGKTTLIKLLTRLYAPTEGRILLDGKDLAAWDLDALRRRIGVVFQDYNRYQLTARENVGFGSTPHMEDADRLSRAITRGGAEEVLATLPSGLDTQLGRWFKDGTELSGGQWQKVALARAFMREEADVLVLDEPTAALDAEAEHAVFERFRKLAEGRTTFVVSHRFPTVRMADRILVIDGGRVIEEGTHAELVAKDGRYARMFALQAEGYR
ncbi:ABC transporter ATP-binding protein [Polyangium jinanense]|uniref:ABC transporter ATP-binding protein n=1 Tax=Polyangium jinanense TaxID=2829994 RepID=A0A9X3XCH7_9BACT|nr:ABC transporter ATP-binding protein [Polyangium jinanense]MDC3961614.1 ABC transporter ATP-binding protein [Polyangium jinanense]MDC3988164.1 ABC transporter ATP-binding protein [Polyangium jinanense]